MPHRLRAHLRAWRRLTRDRDVLSIVQFGLRFELTSSPPLRRRGPTFRGSPEMKRSLLSTLTEWLEMGVIEPSADPATLQSLLFPVPKSNGGWRWVLDSKTLNEHLYRRRFRMETVQTVRSLLQPGDWLASIDLKDAFLHVQVNRRHRRYLAFRALGRQYRFAAMSFGTSAAPRVFTQLMKPVLAQLRREGVRCSIYLDDMILAAQSRDLCVRQVSRAMQLLQSLGFLVNLDKSVLSPTQRLTHLGLTWDTLSFRLFLPLQKWRAMRREARQLLLAQRQHGSVAIRRLAGLAGKLVAASPAVRDASYRRHSLHRCVAFALRHNGNDWTGSVSLTRTVLRDLRWLTSRTTAHLNGSPIQQSEPAAVLTSDASPTGWGATLSIGSLTVRTLGFFSVQESAMSSNWREATGVARAFFAFRRRIQRLPSLHVRTDNTCALSILHRFGSRWRHLGEALDPMLRAVMRWRLELTASHIAGTDNEAADTLSRATKPLRNEWQLSRAAFNRILQHGPRPTVDYFATSTTTRLPRFVSRWPDPKAEAIDAMRQPWQREFGLFVPPINLLPRVLERIVRIRAHGVLVAPVWPSRPWFSTLMAIARHRLHLGPDAMVPVPGHHPLRDGRLPPLMAVWF